MKNIIISQLNQKFPAYSFSVSVGKGKVYVGIISGPQDFSDIQDMIVPAVYGQPSVKPAVRNVWWKKVKNSGYFLKKMPDSAGISIDDISDAVKVMVQDKIKNVKVFVKFGSVVSSKSYVVSNADIKIDRINKDFDVVSVAKVIDDSRIVNGYAFDVVYAGSRNRKAIADLAKIY